MAISIIETGLEFWPSYNLGYWVLGNCYFDLKNYSKCHKILRPFLDSGRDNIAYMRLFGSVCLELKRDDEALEIYKNILFLRPKDEEAMEKVHNLEAQLKKTLILNDRPSDLLLKSSNDIENNSDDIKESKGNINLQFAEKSGGVSHDVPILTITLADIYLQQGHIDKAKEVLEKMALLSPNDEGIRKKILSLTVGGASGISDENRLEDYRIKKKDALNYLLNIFRTISANRLN